MAADGAGQRRDVDRRQQPGAWPTRSRSSRRRCWDCRSAAQCHDHRYDPFCRTDYYRLRARLRAGLRLEALAGRAERLVSLWTPCRSCQRSPKWMPRSNTVAGRTPGPPGASTWPRRIESARNWRNIRTNELQGAIRIAYEHRQATNEYRSEQNCWTENPSVNFSPGNFYQYNQAAADELKKLDAQIADDPGQKSRSRISCPALTEMPGQRVDHRVFHRGDYRQPNRDEMRTRRIDRFVRGRCPA